jgi:hypothetical protein
MTSHKKKDIGDKSQGGDPLINKPWLEGNVDKTRPRSLNQTIIGKAYGGGTPTELMREMDETLSITSLGELGDYHIVEVPHNSTPMTRLASQLGYESEWETGQGKL